MFTDFSLSRNSLKFASSVLQALPKKTISGSSEDTDHLDGTEKTIIASQI